MQISLKTKAKCAVAGIVSLFLPLVILTSYGGPSVRTAATLAIVLANIGAFYQGATFVENAYEQEGTEAQE